MITDGEKHIMTPAEDPAAGAFDTSGLAPLRKSGADGADTVVPFDTSGLPEKRSDDTESDREIVKDEDVDLTGITNAGDAEVTGVVSFDEINGDGTHHHHHHHHHSSGKSAGAVRADKAINVILIVMMALAAVMACAAGFVVFAPATDDDYTVNSPDVYQYATLDAEAVVTGTNALSPVTATIPNGAPTDTLGVHMATAHIEGKGGYSRDVVFEYTVRAVFKTELTIEAGAPAPEIVDFAVDGEENAALSSGAQIMGFVDTYEPGTYALTIRTWEYELPVAVTVVDTTPPVAIPRTFIIENGDGAPEAASFVTDIEDATEVICEFADEYDFTEPRVFDVVVILTDAGGNTTELTAVADCRVDTEPPVIEGLEDMFVTVGGSASYKSGVTATDNSGAEISVEVDASGVDLNALGEYTVTYTAVDPAGNAATEVRKLFVVEKLPPSKEVVMELAKSVYDERIETRDGMTKWEIAKAIYNYAHKITYVGTGIDKSSWLAAAYDGFKTMRGDCFTYMATAKALFEVAGIPTITVERDRHEGESMHFWLLVDIGDGWYHFDATRRRTLPSFDTFMRTDAELQWYCDNYEEHYYRFDHDAYPERGADSYYD